MLILLLVNSEPLMCLKVHFVRHWAMCGLPLLCAYVLTCTSLILFTVLYSSLDFIPVVLSSSDCFWQLSSEYCTFAQYYTNGHQHILPFDCIAPFLFPTLSYTYTKFLPQMHMSFPLQTLFLLPGMTFSSRKTHSPFTTLFQIWLLPLTCWLDTCAALPMVIM